ncbi:hypothetical protein CHELA1G11_12994 [Hyphomicrobiales bacterium]|nr:hypothetical protein CHELA1G2_11316 [Hyphomicrobiales bacterium]CAH1668564.1 hypothetical protein CHELA1G11_12994 [Hyphomicrobiales bacterium]
MTADEKVARIEAFLKDEAILEIFEGVEREYYAAWRATRHDQVGEREMVYARLSVLEKVRRDMKRVAEGQKVEAFKAQKRSFFSR